MSALKRKAGDVAVGDAKKPKKNASLTSFFGQPKKVSTAAKPAAPPFNKEDFVRSLKTSDTYDLLKLEAETLHPSWLALLKDEFQKPYFVDLKRFLHKEFEQKKTVYPPQSEIYSWSQHTPFDKIKVVIIGQDPYHNVNQAHGLCFSVRPPTVAPPSLVNIFKELKNEYPDFVSPPNRGGLLTKWADRGVLLLNTCLTVRAHEANSHQKRGWEIFTQKVIDVINEKNSGVVFMAWGRPAQQRVAKIHAKHLVLKSVHPSPLSAANGWFGNGHFKAANEYLVEKGGEDAAIDWSLGEPSTINSSAPPNDKVNAKAVETSPAESTAVESTTVQAAAIDSALTGSVPVDTTAADITTDEAVKGI